MNDTREKIGPSVSKMIDDVLVRINNDQNIQDEDFTGFKNITMKKNCQVELILSKLIIQIMKCGRLERKLLTANS